MKKKTLAISVVGVAAVATGVGVAAYKHTTSELPSGGSRRKPVHTLTSDETKPATSDEVAKGAEILGSEVKSTGHKAAKKQG